MATTKEDAVRELAEWHFSVEPDLKQVIRIVGEKEDEPNEPIKLLEIHAATVATGSVEAFAFGLRVTDVWRADDGPVPG
ncbi:MAG TPA: hypothetical protein VI072_14675 [Polyangiaceae bacterium]